MTDRDGTIYAWHDSSKEAKVGFYFSVVMALVGLIAPFVFDRADWAIGTIALVIGVLLAIQSFMQMRQRNSQALRITAAGIEKLPEGPSLQWKDVTELRYQRTQSVDVQSARGEVLSVDLEVDRFDDALREILARTPPRTGTAHPLLDVRKDTFAISHGKKARYHWRDLNRVELRQRRKKSLRYLVLWMDVAGKEIEIELDHQDPLGLYDAIQAARSTAPRRT